MISTTTRFSFRSPMGISKRKGTTLGSDNGIGVAAALSVMMDKTLVHGPLELLFTVDEGTEITAQWDSSLIS